MGNQTIFDLAQATTPLDAENSFVELDTIEGGVRVSRKANLDDVNAPATATTAELNDITATINTSSSKVTGYSVFNTTTGAPVWATGSAAGDVWNDATGAVANTPV